MKNLILAETAGFCSGVQHSIDVAERILEEKGKCVSYGELVHNTDAIEALKAKGLRVAENLREVNPDDEVVIRAHGVPKDIYSFLSARCSNLVDATCPNVAAIHKIAENAQDLLFVIGMRKHPEVVGICGWSRQAFVFENAAEVSDFIGHHPDIIERDITVVAQTTQTRSNVDECLDVIKKQCTNVSIFDTICKATFSRQNEAAGLSDRCDAMVVIGGKHSANSIHLAQICEEHCGNVQFIERVSELDLDRLRDADIVGLTAGASTPEWIIKEVRNKMSDEILKSTTEETELSFDEMLEESLKPIYNGEKVVGTVVGISGTEVTVDLGTKMTGFIPAEEFTSGGEKIEDVIKVGDEVEAIVVRVNDVEGTAMLSKKRLDASKFWTDVETASEEGLIVEGVVTEENKGGVVVNVKGVRVFVPASQSGLPRDAEMSELLKKTVKLKITEVNKARKRVVGSIRKAVLSERKALSDAVWSEIEEGKKYLGTVKSLTNYGAFVDIGGIDGMVHQSELSWSRIKHPSDVVSVGDEIEVFVIGFDKENRRISLGYKDPNADPWKMFMDKYSVGDVANVKIVKLMPFGAFAEVMPGIDGLIHISHLSNHRVAKAEDAVTVGENVDAKITAIDEEKHKISLSIRELLPVEESDVDFDEVAEEAEDFVEEAVEAAEEVAEAVEEAVEAEPEA